MDTDVVANIFAVVLLGGVAGFIGSFASPPLRGWLAPRSLAVAALVAVAATAGSLYFSEVAGFEPCRFCWYQRIAMYPLALLLPLAAFKNDAGIRSYAVPLAAIGALLSAYHVRLQVFPDDGGSCDLDNPCSGRWIDALGFLTIPMLAGLSFLLIIGLLVSAQVSRPSTSGNPVS